jgi:hypothetical protein
MTRRFFPLRSMLVLAIMSMAMLLPSRALAQGTEGMVPDPLSTRDTGVLADYLQFDRDQRMAMAGMHADYLDAYRDLREGPIRTLVERFADFTRGQFPTSSEAREFIRLRRQIMTSIEQIDRAFFDDLELLLAPEQAKRLKHIRSMRERERYTIRWFSGSLPPDLTPMIFEAGLAPEDWDAIGGLVDEYELSAVNAVREIHDISWRLGEELAGKFDDLGVGGAEAGGFMAMMNLQQAARAAYEEIGEDDARARQRLLDVTKRSLRSITAALPDATAETIEQTYREGFYRRVYPDRGSVDRYARAAIALPDISDEQIERVGAIAMRHERPHATLTQELVDLYDRLAVTNAALGGGDGRELFGEIWRKSRERSRLNRDAAEELLAVLTEEQADQVRRAVGSMDGNRRRSNRETNSNNATASDQLAAQEAEMELIAARPIARRDLVTMQRWLDLSRDQREAVAAVHASYLASCQELRDGAYTRKVSDPYNAIFRGEGDAEEQDLASLQRSQRQVRTSLQEADAEFFDEMELLLEPVQSRRLDLIRRQHRVASYAEQFRNLWPLHEVGPINVDLLRLLDESNPSEEAIDAATGLLEEYYDEVLPLYDALDEVRERRDRAWAELMLESRRDRGRGDRDRRNRWEAWAERRREMMETLMPDWRSSRDAVEAQLGRTLAQLSESLPVEQADYVVRRFYEQAYPNVYPDPATAEIAFSEAMSLRDLTTPQFEALQAAYATYLDDHAAICGQMVRVSGQLQEATSWSRGMDDAAREKDRRELERLRFEREELNANARLQIEAILEAAQAERMRSLGSRGD